MTSKYHIKCIVCDKKENFDDEQDIRIHKWKIVGWNIKDCEPICLCDKCEYQPVGKPNEKS